MIDSNNDPPTIKKKTLSIFCDNKNKDILSIFKFMSGISKNIYNTTMYIYSIYIKYKEEIFSKLYKNVIANKITNIDQLHVEIQKEISYFYNLHSDKNSVIKHNNDFLYKKIMDAISNNLLSNDNYEKIRNIIINENKNLIKHTNKYEYEFIIDNILKSIYIKNYNKILYQIINKIKINENIYNKDFIEQVKANQHLFPKQNSYKKIIGEIGAFKEIHSDQNIITRFIYLNLRDNKDKIPSDVINNIIAKAFGNINSYYAIKEAGYKAKMCKYLDKNGLFILPFFCRSFKLTENYGIARLTIGKYIANNYNTLISNDYICLNGNDKTDYKLYCNKMYLKSKNQKDKNIKAKSNYIIKIDEKEYYIEKNSEHVINGYYLNIPIPINKIKGVIKLIEINPLYDGRYFKLNITYDVGSYKDNFIKKPKTKKECCKKSKKKIKKKPKKVKVESPKLQNTDDVIKASISIDLGIRNLMTIYDPSGDQVIIKGNYLVSLNSYYNSLIDIFKSLKDKKEPSSELFDKEKYNKKYMRVRNKILANIKKICEMENKKAEDYVEERYYKLLIKRSNKINNFFNNLVKLLHNKYKEKQNIIIGYNIGWKQGINMGRKNNRKFYDIPYSKLIYKLRDKFGEKIKINEESYTSKCDALSLEKICRKENYNGERINRGLYSSKKRKYINADLNGAINIMRKVIDLKKIEGENLYNPKILKIKNYFMKFNKEPVDKGKINLII